MCRTVSMYKVVGWQGNTAAHDTVHGSEPGRALLWRRWVGQREPARTPAARPVVSITRKETLFCGFERKEGTSW